MFLTANALVIRYGIDEVIAKFYVDREPPKDNLYWKGKELYLRPQPGYIFLPLITDLFFRAGVSKQELLSENFVSLLEQIGDISARQEFDLITTEEAVKSCKKLVQSFSKADLVSDLEDYFKGIQNYITQLTTPFKALHRGDLFLFSLVALEIDQHKLKELISIWFALISTLLLLDDAEDVDLDRTANEENAFIESGENKEGFNQIKALLLSNLDTLATINRTLADALHKKFIAMAEKPFIKQYLNA
jgi:hypothetical protein